MIGIGIIRYIMKSIFIAYSFDVIDVRTLSYKVDQIYKSLIYDNYRS